MSFKSNDLILQFPPPLIFTPTLQNYASLWQGAFPASFVNSLMSASFSTALALILGVPAAYALSRWAGLCLFLEDGRIEIDNNAVERAIRPLALNRKNALFAGSDGGAEHWAVIASLIETCKLIGVEPYAYLADVITRIVDRAATLTW